MDRDALIRQLAIVNEIEPLKYAPSRYDAETGTLQCNRRQISRDVISNANNFFSNQTHKYEKQFGEGLAGAYEMKTFFEIDVAAIEQMQDKTIVNGKLSKRSLQITDILL